MESIQFQGHHSRIAHADASLLPDAEHTLWQAWRLPSGNYIIQALTDDKRPCGVTHFLEGALFPRALTPLLARIGPNTWADSPSLIQTWYNEVAALKGSNLYGPPLVEYENFALPLLHPETLAAIERAKAVDDNELPPGATATPIHDTEQPHIKPCFNPATPPLEAMADTPVEGPRLSGKSGKSGKHGKSGDSGKSGKLAATEFTKNASETFNAPVGEETCAPDTPKGPDSPSALPMAEAVQALLSSEFAPRQIEDFFWLLQNDNGPTLAEHVNRLIAIPATEGNTAYQAVLTELGLVLRQKKQYNLAKQCHLRALQLAPNDERILFNIARTEYESGNINAAKDYLNRCLAIAPDFNVAKNFLTFISASS